MDEITDKLSPANVQESPKPLAFTIDFGEGKTVDTQRHKHFFEKYQNRHKRGQSLSKVEDEAKRRADEATAMATAMKKYPLTGNLPRKSSFHSEGYFSSDEKPELKYQGARSSVLNAVISKGDLTLPLRNITSDRMIQSFPNRKFLPSISSPDVELKDISSPELDFISPVNSLSNQQSPKLKLNSTALVNEACRIQTNQYSSPGTIVPNEAAGETFIPGTEFDFEKSDSVSDAGTYTLDADNYTEEEKARMSIDKDFHIEEVSSVQKTQDFVESLLSNSQNHAEVTTQRSTAVVQYAQKLQNNFETPEPTNRITKKIFSKILYPSVKSPNLEDQEQSVDLGVFTSITASGVLSKRPDKKSGHVRRSSLVQSEIFVEAYTGAVVKRNSLNLEDDAKEKEPIKSGTRVTNLPPTVGGISGKNSPCKIPSPVHTITRPRSRNGISSQNLDFSDSSLETESYLQPTQSIISSLQARLSIDSDQDSDYEQNYTMTLNNETKNLLKNKSMYARNNSFDDHSNVKISNKLEHFQNKNLQGIDQTLKTCNQLVQNKAVHRIQNSPNNSPIRRSSSFSLKNQFDNQPKCLNKDSNVALNYPCYQRNGSVQRSASTASIKPNLEQRRSSTSTTEHKIISLVSYDSETSTDDDFEKTICKNKKDLTTTHYNRAFSLRRARLDQPAKCPNTPEMRRKFQPNERFERTVSVDRKSTRGPEVQSRYLNIAKSTKNISLRPTESPKPVMKPLPKQVANKPVAFSRTDTGRFSMRTPKPINVMPPKSARRDQQVKKQSGPRSNSTLSSREVDFQNWKRRKSYDPMKAAAEGKRKTELARKQSQMTQSYNESNQDCDSSPSHSSSVHRSQSFHGTAALEQLITSDDEEYTMSGDEGFSPPTPSPCNLSPSRSNLRQFWMNQITSKR